MSEPFDQWAIVEVMGHNTFAGHVTEQSIGGASFVRVDVPGVGNIPAFTKLIGAGSIYAITPCSEELARKAAESTRVNPVSMVYIPSTRALPAARAEDDYEDLT